MRYLSVCSGIEAASVAFQPLGWTAVGFSEIEPFPCAVLRHHYSETINFGDLTAFRSWPDATVDVLIGGTPCQSFSVAGLRKGLADPRGNLALTYLAVAERYRPRPDRTAVALPFDTQQITSQANRTTVEDGDPASTMAARSRMHVAFQESQSGVRTGDAHPTLDSHNGSRRHHGVLADAAAFNHQSGGDMRGIDLRETAQLQRDQTTAAMIGMQVRRLTPTECARLQGFPDDYLDIIYNGKPAADGPKYKALGNSFAVPVVKWIGQRIQAVEDIPNEVPRR